MAIRNPSVTQCYGIVDYRCEQCPALSGEELIVENELIDVSHGCRNSVTKDNIIGEAYRGCRKGVVVDGQLVVIVLKTRLGL